MIYYNNSKNSRMPFIGDEPTITDDSQGKNREIKVNCIRFFVGTITSKAQGDNIILKHTDSITGVINDWFSCEVDKTIVGLTTFKNVVPTRETPIKVTPSIISGSYSYDGEKESFRIPLLSPVYSNDKIECSISGNISDMNSLTINPQLGVIDISRDFKSEEKK